MIQLTPLEKTVAGQELIQMGIKNTALNLLKIGLLTDEQISLATGLSPDDVKKLRRKIHVRGSRKK
ncbi:MAG: hypothetical protein V2I97_18175 [Desulfococcaceae bacterium]|jgi:hypothetical protein|nr:hypothetical protein [Desulfococcaceae bacterium]